MPLPTTALQTGARPFRANATPAPTPSGTFEAWVRLGTADSQHQPVAALGPITLAVQERVATLTTGSVKLVGATVLEPERWYHLAWRWDAGQGEVTVSVDGEVDGRAAWTPVAGGDLSVGGAWPGQLALVRLWSVARDDAELRAGAVEVDAKGLIGSWSLGAAAADLVANDVPGGPALVLAGSWSIVTAALRGGSDTRPSR
jgi:hypothetical protein